MFCKTNFLIILFLSLLTVSISMAQNPLELRRQQLGRTQIPKLIDLGAPLNDSTFKLWDKYIRDYAPADSAFLVVSQMASRHYNINRAAVAKFIYESYLELFPEKDSIINSRIYTCEQVMLTQEPNPDTKSIYHNYILKIH